jgi:hypothetical protein
MITELVFFDLPKGTTREEAMAKYRQFIGDFADEDVAGGIDAAFGVGVEHGSS